MRRRAWSISMLLLASGMGMSGCRQSERRLILVGDSTMADYPAARAPLSGWGEALRAQLQHWGLVINSAVPGSSTRTYAEICWPGVVTRLRKGDLLMIQFGHNDARADGDRFAHPQGLYRQLLARFVVEARQAGAYPMLATPIPQFRFLQGRVVDSLGAYSDVVRQLATQLHLPLVDLAILAAHEMELAGEAAVRRWYMVDVDGQDTVHLTTLGSARIATLAKLELERQGLLPHDGDFV
jgi:lysophospholipase L1-like esterase